jgi:TPR repeat protein
MAVVLAAAIVFSAPAFAAASAADGPEYIRLMDTSAPRYNTPGCVAAREAAIQFERKQPGRLLLALIPFVGLATASADMEEAEKLNHDLDANCGEEAFVPFFESKAQKGDENAMAWLGQVYYRQQNWEKALYWYGLAAREDHPAALVNLGVMHHRGLGVPRNDAEAERLWREAADDGSNPGRSNLGALYIEQGRNADALKLFREAARRGHPAAQFNLGELYEKGIGVDQDDAKAFGWYSVAAANGYADAAPRRDALAARLPSGVVGRVKRAVRSCAVNRYRRCVI